MMEYRLLKKEEIGLKIFDGFERRQEVNKCRRKIDGEWKIIEDVFTERWNENDFIELTDSLRETVNKGGAVWGAFDEKGKLKGFASAEGEIFGGENKYADLTNLHVSEEMRGRGVGRKLMGIAANWAKERGAEKLYISAHSSVETQAFYKTMGCVEAKEYSAEHVEKEPCDCQLELVL